MFLGSIPESGSIERGEALALAIPSHPNVLETHGLILYNPDTGGFRYATRLSLQEHVGSGWPWEGARGVFSRVEQPPQHALQSKTQVQRSNVHRLHIASGNPAG